MSFRRRHRLSPSRPGSHIRPRPRAGFTLLEVIVATAIFAMAAIVLASAYVNILQGYQIAETAMKSDPDVEFARSLVLNQPDSTKLAQGGEFDGADGRHVAWSVDIEPTNEADLFNVTFTCEITDPSKQQSQPEKTVENFTVLRPTWSLDPAAHDKLREAAKERILQIQGKQPS